VRAENLITLVSEDSTYLLPVFVVVPLGLATLLRSSMVLFPKLLPLNV
jgi:hypothetical protein